MNDPVVSTTGGQVRGRRGAHVEVFKGIPYASGEGRRFLPPAPVTAWTGVRDALEFGPPAPQGSMADPATIDPEERRRARAGFADTFGGIGYFQADDMVRPSEDCLRLNVWTPRADEGRRPVFVWVHGGGFAGGSGATEVFEMSRLAARGDIVAITVNHRLGILGYWELGGILGEEYASSANVATLDLIAALEWVRDNVAAFGGDPDNVMIAGESGGGYKVAALFGAPGARGLFHRAMLRSGAAVRLPDPEQARHRATDVLRHVDPEALDHPLALTTVPADTLMSAQGAYFSTGRSNAFYPTIDGRVITEHPIDAIRDGLAADVPLLIGTTSDEYYGYLAPEDGPLRDTVRQVFGEEGGSEVLKLYGRSRPAETESHLLRAIYSDFGLRIPSIRCAEARPAGGAPVYMYRFTTPNPQLDPPKSSHSWDTAFFFDNVALSAAASASPGAQDVADRASDALIAFTRSGDPGHSGLPEWPVYDTETRPTMRIGDAYTVDLDPAAEERRAWDGRLVHSGDVDLFDD